FKMAKFSMILFIATFLAVYGGANYYLSARGWQAVSAWLPGMKRWVFMLAFWILAGTFVIGQLLFHYLPYGFANLFTIVGYYWLAILFYGVLIAFFIDLFRLADRYLHFFPTQMRKVNLVGLAAAGALTAVLAVGMWSAHHPVISHYSLSINKQAGELKKLHIVAVSDIHLGVIMNKARLDQLVKTVNAQKADVVLIPGDIIDENMDVYVNEKMGAVLSKIKSRYGVYACLGNHEYYSGRIPQFKRDLAKNNVIMLQDQLIEVANSVYVIGRDEYAENPYEKNAMLPLKDLTKGLDMSIPVIVMDHQPARIKEAAADKIDLLLCGHTHNGQIWPIKYLTHKLFIDDYGYYRQGAFQTITSGGYGTWGPPLRVGNRPEILVIDVRFKK
ncbi:MAG: metallophosphoesterase, partial [Candidatus Saccharibacteria bacterium]